MATCCVRIWRMQAWCINLACTDNGSGLLSAAEDSAVYLWRTALDAAFILYWLTAHHQPQLPTCLQPIQVGLMDT